MKTIKLTDEQADTLTIYIEASSQYRKENLNECRDLAQKRNENGSAKYPLMEEHVTWWELAEKHLSEIQKIIDNTKE